MRLPDSQIKDDAGNPVNISPPCGPNQVPLYHCGTLTCYLLGAISPTRSGLLIADLLNVYFRSPFAREIWLQRMFTDWMSGIGLRYPCSTIIISMSGIGLRYPCSTIHILMSGIGLRYPCSTIHILMSGIGLRYPCSTIHILMSGIGLRYPCSTIHILMSGIGLRYSCSTIHILMTPLIIDHACCITARSNLPRWWSCRPCRLTMKHTTKRWHSTQVMGDDRTYRLAQIEHIHPIINQINPRQSSQTNQGKQTRVINPYT